MVCFFFLFFLFHLSIRMRMWLSSSRKLCVFVTYITLPRLSTTSRVSRPFFPIFFVTSPFLFVYLFFSSFTQRLTHARISHSSSSHSFHSFLSSDSLSLSLSHARIPSILILAVSRRIRYSLSLLTVSIHVHTLVRFFLF